MSQHEVEVRPYGTKNELPETKHTSSSRAGEPDYKPPYGQKNEVAGVSVTAQAPPSGFMGSRADVEVRPLGAADTTGLNKTTTRTTTRQQINLEQWKNPLLATLLGITLALTLLSLSYVPRAISGAWHWGTSWLPGLPGTKNLPSMPETEGIYQRGKDILQDTKNMYNERVDQASNLAQNAKETGESIIDRVKHTGESLMHAGGSGPTLTEQAKQMACHRAQQAQDLACNGVDMRSFSRGGYGSDILQQAKDAAGNVQHQTQGAFEHAKQRASDILEHAKDTVTYPLHAASERLNTARDSASSSAQNAADQAQDAAERARQSTYSTLQTAKDRVGNAAENAKETVLGAGQAAKDTVLNAGEAVKETIVNAGHAAKDMASNAANTIKGDKVTTEKTTSGHGQTRVKVEVQEL